MNSKRFPLHGYVPFAGSIYRISNCVPHPVHGWVYDLCRTGAPEERAVPQPAILRALNVQAHYAVGQVVMTAPFRYLHVEQRRWNFRTGTVVYVFFVPSSTPHRRRITERLLVDLEERYSGMPLPDHLMPSTSEGPMRVV